MYRSFLSAAVLAAAFAVPAQAQEIADRIFTGGPVLTMNDAQPRAEAVAVKDGKIIAVGTVEEIMALKGEGTEVTTLRAAPCCPASSTPMDTSSSAACRR